MMSSCKEDSSFLGYDILNPNDTLNSILIDTLTVQFYNEEAHEIKSYNQSLGLVGNQSDANFGTTSASSIVQFGLYRYTDTFKIDQKATNFTASLTLKRNLSVKTNVPVTINIYQVNKRLYDSISYSSTSNPKDLVDYTAPIGTFTANPTDSIYTINLSSNFAQFLASKKLIVNNKNFLDFFNGLYYEPEKPSSDGSIYSFNLNYKSSYLTFSYKSDTTTKSINLYRIPETRCANVNYYTHSKNTHLANDSVLYISGLAGYRVRVSFPTLNVLQDPSISINKAELIIQADTSANQSIPYPTKLDLYRNDISTTIPYTTIRDYAFTINKLNKENQFVKLNITCHIQDFISRRITTGDFYIHPYGNEIFTTQLILLNRKSNKAKLRILYSHLR